MAKKRYGPPRSADTVLGVPQLELISGILERIPGTHAAAVSYFIASGEYKRAAELRADPRDFDDPDGFALALLSTSLIRKYPGLPGSSRKRDVAIEKWRACEEQCGLTNERLRQFRIGELDTHHHEAFRLARKKIQKLLGTFRWSKVAEFFNFGPGSTTRLPFAKRHLPFKYGIAPETTFDNLASARAVISLSPVWTLSTGGRVTGGCCPCFSLREHSKVTTVPKDAFIDRVIAIEPDMNMFVQKGFGGFIRQRLKLVGIDLDDQTLNQLLARSGSATGSLATLDLSSASDTVSYELVRELLPPDWFEALLSCRTHESRLPSGEIVSLQKFSAMGNGFTFELESLIFWALCSAVCQNHIGREGLRVSVYGDDLIVKTEDYEAVVQILEFSGFTVNLKKSFASGPYRESCGKHYFHGRDVTPITITKEMTHVSRLLLFCNNIQRWALRRGQNLYRCSSVREVYQFGVSHLPRHFQKARLPEGYGDGSLLGSFDECLPKRARGGWDGWMVQGVLLPRKTPRRSNGVATLAAALSVLEGAAPSGCDEFPIRDADAPRVYHDIGGGAFPQPVHDGILGLVVPGGRSLSPASRVPKGIRRNGTELWSIGRTRNSSSYQARAVVGELCGSRVQGALTLKGMTTPASDIGEVNSSRCGPVFVPLWCDIGPWLP